MNVENAKSKAEKNPEGTGDAIPGVAKSETEEQPTEDQVRKELEEERAKAEAYLNQLKRLKADYENLQRRTKREMDELIKSANERLIVALLGVLDNLELAVEAGKKSDRKEELTRGVEMVLDDLKETLKREGLAEIDAAGKRFDPHRHMVMDKADTDAFEDETVIAVLRKGYMLNGRVIRPSFVRVAVKSTPKKCEEEKTE